MMKKTLIISLLLFFINNFNAQSIRKNYKEMTQSEKNALVNAFYQLRNGADLINDLATFHVNNFGAIHFNPPQTDVFLAWHRRQIFELEQAMQNINPNITIPFWDWTTDNSVNSDLWDNDFLGQFNNDWTLNRNLGGRGSLPNSSDVNLVQVISNWNTYNSTLENGIVHTGPHLWTGGIMSGGASPRDPVFYLHHGMVDKLWQDWVEVNVNSSANNIYQKTSLPRYDGTYTFNGKTLPLVNPNNILDSRSLGVFFAENKLAQLDNYVVSNTYNNQENFYYQYTIEAGNNFIVPSGKNAKIESINNIILQPGFHSIQGSSFIAKIDSDNNIVTRAKQSSTVVARNQKPFDDIHIIENAYINSKTDENILTDSLIKIYPNPTSDFIYIESSEKIVEYALSNSFSKQIFTKKAGAKKLNFTIENIYNGVYVLKVSLESGKVIHKKIIKK